MNNPFAIFDLPVSFEVDNQQLSERYLALQKSLHPDNFVSATSTEQRQAMQQSTAVNDALKILKDPILRAESIIQLNCGEMQDIEQKSTNDVAFLMQQLQWREQLSELEQSQDEEGLEDFSQQIKQQAQLLFTQLAENLASQQWKQAETVCDKLRFMQKLKQEIELVEDRLFDL